ncbi:MAG TPA: thioredoxin family protein [Albitalea sp.]|nr:thioredoxin family protein [Albitalea sp.]
MKARLFAIAPVLLLAACTKPAPSAPPAPPVAAAAAASAPRVQGIAWTFAANDAQVDAAFAQARSENKPVFVYWGAKWCPPCNQVKATLFNRIDFIERSRAFVPIYIDGDSPGAQKLGTRFKVRGYPTMVLFSPQGAELTRLPGEVDAAQITRVLTLGMDARRPVKAVLADATRGGAGLAANDWKLLAFYSWETDEQQLVDKAHLPMLLKRLAAACPKDQADTAGRLLLQALAAAGDEHPAHLADAAARTRLEQLLADADAARRQMDVLTNNAADIVRAASHAGTAPRTQLLAAFDAALRRLQADATLSRADRLTALQARVELARIDQPKDSKAPPPPLPASLLAEVREQAARMDHDITDGYERQAVITEAAYLLAEAGLLDESDALLQANLSKSHSPYYLMSELASNARKRGDAAAALSWSKQAFEQAEGPATRLQWGAGYIKTLVDLAPTDEAAIETTAQQLFDEAGAQPNAFYERNARSLQRAGGALAAWNKAQAHHAAMQRLQARLHDVCARLPAADQAQRTVCEGLLSPPAAKGA